MNLLDELIESFILIELSSSLFVLLISYPAYHGNLIILGGRVVGVLIVHSAIKSWLR